MICSSIKSCVYTGVTYQDTRNLIPAMSYLVCTTRPPQTATSNTVVETNLETFYLFIGVKITDSDSIA